MRLQGKVALVSGASRGIGAAIARLFAGEGARVVLGDVLAEQGERVVQEIRAGKGEALFVKLDVTSESDWQRAMKAAVERFGKLNVLVNNAAILIRATVEQTTREDWDRLMAVNATGVFLGTRYAIPEMRKAGGGSIVNLSSSAALSGNPMVAAYSATKGAVLAFTRATAIEYAPDNIRANTIHPGGVETAMTAARRTTAEGLQQLVATHPLARLGQPEDIAYGALYLASDESSWVTGIELKVDGGMLAR